MNKVELQKAIGDIYYEIQMLSRSYTEYWKHEASDRLRLPKWIHHSVIEATLIHTRALLDFFERPAQKLDEKNDFVRTMSSLMTMDFHLLQFRYQTSCGSASILELRI